MASDRTAATVGRQGWGLPLARARRPQISRRERHNMVVGLLFISPWLVGFLAFMVYPIIYSLWMSFTHYTGFGAATWIGFDNYTRMFSDDLFYSSFYNTLYFTILAVPIGVVVAIILALAMNQKVREVAIYRAALYLPSILPIFALAFIWVVLLNPRYGLLDYGLVKLGLPSIDWMGDPSWTKPAVVLLAQLGAGGPALIFLAALRGIPRDLYESAGIDGANVWRKFYHITLPMLTPVILYDLILGLSLGLQAFTQAYILTSGGANEAGPGNSLLFYVFYLYKNAFQYSDMGYASALAWVLFIVSLVLALAVFRWSKSWVHYEMK